MQTSKPPRITPSFNSSSTFSSRMQISALDVQNALSFFGVTPSGQAGVVNPTVNAIILLLQRYGLAPAGYTQEGSKLIGTGSDGAAAQGISVALSYDGTTLAIGGDNDDDVGATWIFVKNSGIWTQQGDKLVGTEGIFSSQGYAVALSADGNTLAVGGYNDNDNGATWIFTRSDTTWTQQGDKLVGSDSTASNQGISVSLSSDGNTLAVGGNYANSRIGATWIYTRTDSVWTEQQKLVGTGYIGTDIEQGTCVSLSADGNTVAAGGPLDNDNIGATWIFTRTSDVWTQQGSKLVGSGYIGENIDQGYSVALKGDTVVVGGYSDNSDIGAAWVFKRTGTTWTQVGSKLVGTGYIGTDVEQGGSVSINADENILIVGGGQDNSGVGAVWVFKLANGVWTQYKQKLVGSGYVGTPKFGFFTNDICISGDGHTIAFGGQEDSGGVGATWVFVE